MWFLFFFIVIPLVLFVGLYLFSVIVIFLINKILHKKYSQYLSLILPCLSSIFYFMLIMGGISFKSIDPQYYEFKRLCEEVKNERTVHNENLYRIYQYFTNGYDYYLDDEKTQKTYYKSDFTTRERVQLQKISNKISEYKEWLYYEDMPLLSYKDYTYKYFGIFLGGDEGAGWHINPKYKALECKNIRY